MHHVVRRHDRAHDRALHVHIGFVHNPGGVLTWGDFLAHFFEVVLVHAL